MGFSFYIADPVKDREIILKLWKDNIQADDFERRFNWLYHENPAGSMRTVLAVHDETREVVGAGSLYPQKFQLFGKPVIFGTAADYMVDSHFRVFGPAVQIQRKLLEFATDFGFDYLLGFPNKAAKGVIKHIGYEQVGFANRYVKLIKTHDLLVDNNLLPIFPVTASFFIDSFFLIEDSLKSLFYKVKYRHIFYDNVKSLKSEPIFFENNKPLVILDKSLERLAWRYNQDMFRFFSVSVKNSNQSNAFLVYTRSAGIVSIIDIIFANFKFLAPLLNLFVSEMHKMSVKRVNVNFLGDRRLIYLLKKLRFHLRDSDRACYLFVNRDITNELREKISDENSWFIFDSDMDI